MHKDWTNVDWFDCFAVKILGDLYARFPLETELDPSKLPVLLQVPEFNDEERKWEVQQIPSATIRWLLDEGFVRASEPNLDGEYHDLILTHRGLAVLKKVPTSLQPGKSLGEHAKDLAANTLTSLTADALKAAATAIFS